MPDKLHLRPRTLVAGPAALLLSACGTAANLGVIPTPPVDPDCWFLRRQPVSWEGYTTLGELGMAPRDLRWDDVRVYAWITRDAFDLYGTGEQTRAVCTVTDDPEVMAAGGIGTFWSEYPVVNSMPDHNDDPP
jgi:hypothetical protein